MTRLGIARSEVGVAVPRYVISENLKESCKGSDRNSRIREAVYENRSGTAQFPEENSQPPEAIRSIPEVKRRGVICGHKKGRVLASRPR